MSKRMDTLLHCEKKGDLFGLVSYGHIDWPNWDISDEVASLNAQSASSEKVDLPDNFCQFSAILRT